MDDSALEGLSDARLLRLASLRLSLLLTSHRCPEHGDRCRDRFRAEEVIREINRRYPLVRRRPRWGRASARDAVTIRKPSSNSTRTERIRRLLTKTRHRWPFRAARTGLGPKGAGAPAVDQREACVAIFLHALPESAAASA